MSNTKITFYAFLFILCGTIPSFSGASVDILESDSAGEDAIVGFFDLRDRETFIQVTNIFTENRTFHIQIFNVADNCNENDFFDAYTPSDTHVYNLRDILTNDGNDSGVVLPEGAYGIFSVYDTGSESEGTNGDDKVFVGNLRVLDINGYEYRTNLVSIERSPEAGEGTATFNFNTKGGVTLSDIVGFVSDENGETSEILMANVVDTWYAADVDIYDLNEVPFSCRNVIISCVNDEHPLYEAVLENAANRDGRGCDPGECAASVASFEYGINNAIPHSKGGELLCPGNNISEGFVRFQYLGGGEDVDQETTLFIGLNNGNGRGSMDNIWLYSDFNLGD